MSPYRSIIITSYYKSVHEHEHYGTGSESNDTNQNHHGDVEAITKILSLPNSYVNEITSTMERIFAEICLKEGSIKFSVSWTAIVINNTNIIRGVCFIVKSGLHSIAIRQAHMRTVIKIYIERKDRSETNGIITVAFLINDNHLSGIKHSQVI